VALRDVLAQAQASPDRRGHRPASCKRLQATRSSTGKPEDQGHAFLFTAPRCALESRTEDGRPRLEPRPSQTPGVAMPPFGPPIAFTVGPSGPYLTPCGVGEGS
jgi:hypothetical protein